MTYKIDESPQGTVTISTQGPGPAIVWQASGLTTQGHLISGQFSGQTTASYSGSGTVVAPLFSGNDTAGRITWSTASGAAVGNQVTLAYGTPYATTPIVMITEANASTAGAYAYVNSSTGGFTVFTGLIPVASGTYSIAYYVIA